MSMNSDYLNAAANGGAAAVTHIGLVDTNGDEVTGGSYERKAVSWSSAVAGVVRPSGNLVFTIPAGQTVAGWRGYSAASAGTDYGGADLTPENFTGQGTYTLLAAQTAINHLAG